MIESAFFETSDFRFKEEKLGEGTFGDVYIAENIENKKRYAVKILKTNNNFNGKQQMHFMRESLIHHGLKHPGIVEFIGVNFQSFRDSTILEPSIITEYLPQGSLKDILAQERRGLSNPKWSPTKKYIMLLGISNAMKYLHNHKIIHRDLKPGNILVDKDLNPKICDFGLSRYFVNSSSLTMTDGIGTPLYMAPELINSDINYTQSIDVYAFSMIMYEIVTGKVPFCEFSDSPFKLFTKVVDGYRPKFPKFVTEKMKELISRCWSGNGDERPSFDQIYKELSSDFSYLGEDVDEEEILSYIEKIEQKEVGKTDCVYDINKKLQIKHEKTKKLLINLKPDENFTLALHQLHGRKNEINHKEAVNQLKISSQKGNCNSSYLLGLLYENGGIVEEDFNKAFFYFQLSFQQGNSSGFNEIGFCYQNCFGVKQNFSKAEDYYLKSADLENSFALNNLGFLYYSGNGVKQNFSKAFEFYSKSADLGNSDSLNKIAFLYQKGYGVKQNLSKAFEFYQKSADLGNSVALINLGLFYCNGYAVKQNYLKAAECYKKSADLGNSFALINLGLLYQNGYGCKKDFLKASACFKKSLEMGNSNALNNLNYLYENGFID